MDWETRVAVVPPVASRGRSVGGADGTSRGGARTKLRKERRRYLLSIHNGRPAGTPRCARVRATALMFTSAELRARGRRACVHRCSMAGISHSARAYRSTRDCIRGRGVSTIGTRIGALSYMTARTESPRRLDREVGSRLASDQSTNGPARRTRLAVRRRDKKADKWIDRYYRTARCRSFRFCSERSQMKLYPELKAASSKL